MSIRLMPPSRAAWMSRIDSSSGVGLRMLSVPSASADTSTPLRPSGGSSISAPCSRRRRARSRRSCSWRRRRRGTPRRARSRRAARRRAIGIVRSAIAASSSSVAGVARPAARSIGVSTSPGATALTRMPSRAWSSAIARVRLWTAPLAAQYAAWPWPPVPPQIEPKLTIAPAAGRLHDAHRGAAHEERAVDVDAELSMPVVVVGAERVGADDRARGVHERVEPAVAARPRSRHRRARRRPSR